MKGQLTIRQYRAIDLSLFALMLMAAEALMVQAAVRWFPGEPYTVSATALVTAIVMMRWGPWAAIHAVLGGLVHCLVSGAAPRHYMIYCLGNVFSLLALLLFRKDGREKIRNDPLLCIFFGLLTVILMSAGRAAVSLLFGASLWAAAGFFTTEVITALFTVVILWIARRLDGIFEDQRHYLLRVSQEQAKEKEEYR